MGASALAMGCTGVWVGTRFIASDEAGAGPYHKKSVVNAGFTDTIRTTIYSGRPLRVIKTPYVLDWEENRAKEKEELQNQGILAASTDMKSGTPEVRSQDEMKRGVQLTKKEELER